MGDGRILKVTASRCQLLSPEQLKAGDLVHLRLWLPSEDTPISVPLAEVRWVERHWFGVETIQVEQDDRIKLRRFVDAYSDSGAHPSRKDDLIMIRA